MGWDIAILKQAGNLRSGGQNSAAARLLYLGLRDTTGTWLASTLVIAPILVRSFDFSLGQAIGVHSIGLLWAYIGLLSSFLRSFYSVTKTQMWDALGSQLLPQAVVILMVAMNFEIGVTTVASLAALGAFASCVGLLGVVLLKSAHKGFAETSSSSVDRRLALRLWMSQVLGLLSSRCITLITVPVAGLAAGGLIEAGLRVQQVGGTLAWVTGTVVSPRYARSGVGSSDDRARLLNISTWVVLAPSVLWALTVLSVGENLLSLLGDAYSHGRLAISLMAVAGAADALAASCGYFFAMTGLEGWATRISLIQLICLLSGVLILGRLWGAEGAAISVLAASLVRSGASIWLIKSLGLRSPLAVAGLRETIWAPLRARAGR
jgi:O-antigen/teichoic acid export membrane protein